MGILSWIIVGLIAGWLAGVVVRGGGYGLIGDIIVGIVGGLLGGYIGTSLLHIDAAVTGINLESILVSFCRSGGANFAPPPDQWQKGYKLDTTNRLRGRSEYGAASFLLGEGVAFVPPDGVAQDEQGNHRQCDDPVNANAEGKSRVVRPETQRYDEID